MSPSRKKSMCKGPEVEVNLECLTLNSQEAYASPWDVPGRAKWAAGCRGDQIDGLSLGADHRLGALRSVRREASGLGSRGQWGWDHVGCGVENGLWECKSRCP